MLDQRGRSSVQVRSVLRQEAALRAALDAEVKRLGLDYLDLVSDDFIPKVVTVGKRAPGAWMLSMAECRQVLEEIQELR